MTRLRPRTARQIAEYPSSPVVYRRPVLRAFFALFYGGTAAFLVWTWVAPDQPADRLTSQDWWEGPVFFAVLGGAYLYASSRLVVDTTHARIYNPLRRVAIPLGHVTGVTSGRNLAIVTGYATFSAWAVEAANVQVAAESYGTQGDLAELIMRAAHTAGSAAERPARYRFSPPDPFFWIVGCLYVAIALYEVFAL
jgi:hypothetical protein